MRGVSTKAQEALRQEREAHKRLSHVVSREAREQQAAERHAKARAKAKASHHGH